MSALLADSSPIALWGAILSTLLAAIKLSEVWRARLRIEIDPSFTDNEDIGNEIIIRNLGAVPLMITHWELVWRERHFPRWKESSLDNPGEDYGDIRVNAHSSITMQFREQRHFSTSHDVVAGRKIFIRLFIAGRSRPILRRVYG